MANYSFITYRLAIGAALTCAEDVAVLRGVGINAVIDLRAEFDDGPLFAGSAIQYCWNPAQDDGVRKSVEWFKKSLDFAMPLLAMPGNKILCHCEGGMNRGPSTAYAILRALGFSPLQAHSWIVVARPQTIGGLRYVGDADLAVKELGYC